MPDTAYKQNPEPFQIVTGCKAIEDLNIAIIARSTSEVEDPERFFEAVTFKPHSF
jgi:hypothetical protein